MLNPVGAAGVAALISLFFVNRKVNRLMAKEQDLENSVAALEAEIIVIAAEVAALKAGGVQNVTQEQLDSLDGRLQAAVAALKAAE